MQLLQKVLKYLLSDFGINIQSFIMHEDNTKNVENYHSTKQGDVHCRFVKTKKGGRKM